MLCAGGWYSEGVLVFRYQCALLGGSGFVPGLLFYNSVLYKDLYDRALQGVILGAVTRGLDAHAILAYYKW